MTHYNIVYGKVFDPKSLRGISPAIQHRLRKAIEQKLTMRPTIYGKPLRQSLRGGWSLRVGDYRVIYRIEEDTVEIYAIEHRSVVYEHLKKQFGKGLS